MQNLYLIKLGGSLITDKNKPDFLKNALLGKKVDTGPNLHVICQARQEGEILRKSGIIASIEKIIVNKPASGAHLV